MMIILIFIAFCSSMVHFVAGNCSPCPPPPKHYSEFGCKGISLGHGQCCAVKYICPDRDQFDRQKCHYAGETYQPNDIIPDLESPLCMNSCQCTRNSSSSDVAFQCAHIQQEANSTADDGCLRQYSPDNCRHVSRVCGPEKINKLGKCNWRGKEYYEGERFTPESDPCFTCYCDANFDNSTRILDNVKSCFPLECGLELTYEEKFRLGCAPVYTNENRCCPSDEWICPQTQRIKTARDDMRCTFGDELIEHWDYLKTGDECLECRCTLPPFLTCHRKCTAGKSN